MITCSLDVAGRRAISFPYEIWLFLNMLHRYCNFLSFSNLFPRFVILFIISSSVLEQAGFSEIEGVISSNPTWQCLHFVFFLHSFKFACLLEINIRSLTAHFAVLPLRSRRAQPKTNPNSNIGAPSDIKHLREE